MYSSITFKTLADWSKGELSGAKSFEFPVSHISTDTRTLKSGDIYLALKGESFDGNQFVQQAIRLGATGVICETAEPLSVPKIRVPDALKALISIGENLRSLFQGKVFAITGSAGKSSTKDMVAVLLGDSTVSSPASFNNLMGVSRTLCLVTDITQNLVLEMGMNNFGEIAELCQRFRPQYGMITNIGDAHIGKLGGQEGIYRAKKEMFDFLAQDPSSKGVALNADDSWVMEAFKSNFNAQALGHFQVKTYSQRQKTADVFLKSSLMDPDSGFLNLKIEIDKEELSVSLPIFGEHQAQNIIAALAMVRLVEVSLGDIRNRINRIRPAAHRGEILTLSRNRVLIDETYNSNPKALISSLSSLKKLSPQRRKILVIGEMRELGVFSESLHDEIGSYLVDWATHEKPSLYVVTVQGDSKKISDKVRAQCPQIPVHHFETVAEAIEKLPSLTVDGDLLFLKGSRGVNLDLLSKALAS